MARDRSASSPPRFAAFCVAWSLAAGDAPTRSRPGEAGAIAPLAHELYLEGRSTDEAVAGFRGRAFATTVAGQPGDDPSQGQTWYLVDDVRKPAPVWVREDDVRRSPSGLASGEPVIGYVTVSSEARAHATPTAACAEIEEACERAGVGAGRGRHRPRVGPRPRAPGAGLRVEADRRGQGPRPRGQRPAAADPLDRRPRRAHGVVPRRTGRARRARPRRRHVALPPATRWPPR